MNNILLNNNEGYNVSTKYKPIPSIKLLETLTDSGYEVTNFVETTPRKASKQGFQKHMIRLAHPELNFNIDGLRPEIVITNSYDKSSSIKIQLGVFRLVCSNGLVVGKSFNEYRIRHVGNALDKCMSAISSIKVDVPRLAASITRLSNIQLEQEQVKSIARNVAVKLVPKNCLPVIPVLTQVRRHSDSGIDAFSILNVIQENALRGGMPYLIADKSSYRRTQRIRSIDRVNTVNQLVWNEVERAVGGLK